VFTGKPRKLTYPLDRSVSLWGETPDEVFEEECNLPAFPEDSDERIDITFNVSLNEFVALASALDAGRDLSHPEQETLILWIWMERLSCMEFCERVENCIRTDGDVDDALADLLQNPESDLYEAVHEEIQRDFDANNPGDRVPDATAQQPVMPPNPGCDNDTAYGHIYYGIVGRGMQHVQDVLEQIELTTDNQEMLAQTLATVPVLGEVLDVIGVDSFIAFLDNVRAFLKDAFEAGDTLEKRSKMACDLFCIWQQSCSLSFEQIRQYFWANVRSAFATFDTAFVDLFNLMEALANPTELTGEFVVDALMGAEYGYVSFINSFFGVTLRTVRNDALMGDTNDDWMVDCDTCPICYLWDFNNGTDEWSVTYGDYGVLGGETNGFIGEVVGSETRITIQYDFASPIDISHIELATSHADIFLSITTDTGNIVVEGYHPATLPDVIDYSAAIVGANWLKIEMWRTVPDGYIDLQTIQIYFVGDTPTGGDLCV